jgi:hypothetical protein
MCHYADKLAATGAHLCDDELVANVLARLNEDYNPVFTATVARTHPITPSDLYTQLLWIEQHISMQGHSSSGASSSAMAASHGHGSTSGRGYGGSDRGHVHSSRGRSSSNDSRNSYNDSSWPQCQVCLKIGHATNNGWHHFDKDYVPEQRTAAATSSSGTDQPWYMDSGATYHIIRDHDCLMMHEACTGTDQIHIANRSGMDITRIGTSIIPTTTRPLALNHVLHVSSSHKNLIFVHRFTLYNDTFIEFHPFFFLIKDQKMRKVLL